jgi:uncharacterized membrane protein YvbJ
MADRYCRECGHELNPEDQFCPHCGRPVHETARVPTSEADVPTPPPPRQSEQQGPFLYQTCLNIGCAIILILIILFVLALLLGIV